MTLSLYVHVCMYLSSLLRPCMPFACRLHFANLCHSHFVFSTDLYKTSLVLQDISRVSPVIMNIQLPRSFLREKKKNVVAENSFPIPDLS